MKSFKRLKEYFYEYRWQLLLGLICLLVVDALQLFIPRVIKWAVDDIAKGGIVQSHLIKYGLYIICIAISIAFFRFWWRYFIFGVARKVEMKLRNRLFSHLQTLSFSYFNSMKTGDLMAHATNDMNAVRRATGLGVVFLVDVIFLGAASIGFMLYINIKLTLFAIIPMPFIALVSAYFGKLIYHRFEVVQETFASMTERARENVAGTRVVKSYVQEKNQIRKFGDMCKDYLRKNMHLVKIWGAFFPLIIFFANLSLVVVIFLGGKQVIFNNITPGDFVAFSSYLWILAWPMMALGWVINMLQRGAASMGRINKIFDTQPEIKDSKDVKSLKINGKVEFSDVIFSYAKNLSPVLKDINLTIIPGETVAIVGRTGAGKTTLCNLIPRLFDVKENRLFIDGCEIHTIPLSDLRGSIGYIPQDTFLFSDTVKENIAFGRFGVSEDEIHRAAKIAQIYDEVMEFPDGFDSIIGERGVNLSGGQKQRIALARAILLDPKIFILDDALSSVDTDTEEKILLGLKRIMKGRTNIVVSHRIASIKDADRIIVLEDGRIVEEGNHTELLRLNGIYSDIYQKQQLEEELEDFSEERTYG